MKVFATSGSLDYILLLLTKIIASLDLTLSEKIKGLTVCQSFLLLAISSSFNLEKYSFSLSQKENTVVSLFII